MKKILVVVLALGVIFGAGLSVKKDTQKAGEPPIGSSPVVVSMVHTMGEPPIGS